MDKPTAEALLQILEGQKIIGGCLDCHAYQQISSTDEVIRLDVFHDEECPFYRGALK